MRLGIDLDGVVCDFNAGWMQLHMAEFGSELKPEMVVTWNSLHELGGFADMQAFWRWAQATEDRPSIFRHLEPFPDALETLHALRDAGHRIVILTAKPRWAIPDTLRWIADGGDPHPLPQVRGRVRRLPRRLADGAPRSRAAPIGRSRVPDDPAVERTHRGNYRHRRLALVRGVRRVALSGDRPGGLGQLC